MAPELSETQWEDTFEPLDGPDGTMLWDSVPDGTQADTVWTVVDSDDGERSLVLPGIHVVNRIGYSVTAVPWTDPDTVGVWADMTDLED